MKERLEKLGQDFERRKLLDLQAKHIQEKEKIEADYKEEMTKFESFWEEKIKGFQDQAQQMLEQARERQQEALGAEQTKLKENTPKLDRYPPEVLNVEFQINKLAKEQRYTEAHNLKKKLEKLVGFADPENRGYFQE